MRLGRRLSCDDVSNERVVVYNYPDNDEGHIIEPEATSPSAHARADETGIIHVESPWLTRPELGSPYFQESLLTAGHAM